MKLSEITLKNIDSAIQRTRNSDDLIVYVNGGGGTNKCPLKGAFIIYKNNKMIKSWVDFQKDILDNELTSNNAVCLAIIEACRYILENNLHQSHRIVFYSNNEIVSNQFMDLHWRRGDETKGYYNSWMVMRGLLSNMNYRSTWIPKELNKMTNIMIKNLK